MNQSQVGSVLVRNTSEHDAPPFGVLQVAGVEASGTDLVILVTRPTAEACNSGRAAMFLFNGPDVLEAGESGEAFAASPFCLALMDTTKGVDGTRYKVFCGPVSNSFVLGAGWVFEILAGVDPLEIHEETDTEVRMVGIRTNHTFAATAKTAITVAGGGTVTLSQYNGGFGFAGVAVDVPAVTMVSDIEAATPLLCQVVNNTLVAFEVC